MIYAKYKVRHTEFFATLGHFWPFHPNNPENQKFENLKK